MSGHVRILNYQVDTKTMQYIVYCDRCNTTRAGMTMEFVLTVMDGQPPGPVRHWCPTPERDDFGTEPMLPPVGFAPVGPTPPPMDAPNVWVDDPLPGGWVCGRCGEPVESEPCKTHQPLAYERCVS